jgi:hypothetical protein
MTEQTWDTYEPPESDVTAVYDRQTGKLRIAHGNTEDAWIDGYCFNLLETR